VTVDSGTFELNEENKAKVLDHGKEVNGPTYERTIEVTDAEKENIILAAQSCPTLAISIFDEDGRQVFPEV
jgi:ferredoxin